MFDSAGVQIIEYATLGPEPRKVRLDPEPYLELGGLRESPDEEFDVRHVNLTTIELADGTIVVNDRTRLLFFSKSGALLRTAGRPGSGPGEFNEAGEMCLLRGDSILVKDGADGRMSLWDRDGKHVQTWARVGYAPRDGCRPDGTFVLRDQIADAAGGASGEASYAFSLRRPDGTRVRDLGPLPSHQYLGPYLREPSYVPVDDELWVGDAKSFEVRAYGPARELRRLVRVNDRVRVLTDDEWARMVDMLAGDRATEERRAAMRKRFLRVPRPSTWPAYWRIQVDPAKRMWIQSYAPSSQLVVFDSTFMFLGVLDLQAPLGWLKPELAGLAVDHMVVRVRDQNRAVRLRFYRLR